MNDVLALGMEIPTKIDTLKGGLESLLKQQLHDFVGQIWWLGKGC